MVERGGVVQPIWPVCFDETVSYMARGEKEEEMNGRMKTLLNVSSKYCFELLEDLQKERQ